MPLKMNPELQNYIEKKRAEGTSDEQIKANLVAAGWDATLVQSALRSDKQDDVPAPPPVTRPVFKPQEDKVESGSYGVEYIIMMLSLWIAAGSLASLMHYVVGMFGADDGLADLDYIFNAAATAGLLVSLPVFTFLFFRLHKQEAREPRIKNNGSRKLSIYAALIIAFLTAIFQVIWGVFALMSSDSKPFIEVANIAVTISVAGPIIFYYLRQIRGAKK